MSKALKEYYIACNNVVSEFVGEYFDCEHVDWKANHYFCNYGYEFTAHDGDITDDGLRCSGYWESQEVGGNIEIDGYIFSMDRIIEALKLGATKDQLIEYDDLEIERNGKVGYNFQNFVRYGKDQMEEVIKKK